MDGMTNANGETVYAQQLQGLQEPLRSQVRIYDFYRCLGIELKSWRDGFGEEYGEYLETV